MTKKISLSLVAVIVSSCLLISVGLIVAAIFLFKSEKAYKPTSVAVTPLSIDEQMDLIQQQVSDFRGLAMTAPLDRALMTSEELQEKVKSEFFVDYTHEDAQNDVKVLSTIGLLEPDYDLLQFYIDLYSEQIAGYFDSETKEMNVISDAGFGGLERMTYAHEFTHVLQDQNYDLENGLMLNDDYCENHTEYCQAVTAVIEGDAVLSEQFWFLMYGTDQDKAEVMDFYAVYESPVYDSAPDYMKQDFMFPYQQGFDFVNGFYNEKKWDSVEALYQKLPVSTEQILHPERYPNDVPEEVILPDLFGVLGDEWTEIDRNTMGEWYSYLILSAGVDQNWRLDQATAGQATEGWGGDTYLYVENEKTQSYIYAWLSTWDTALDADEFLDASLQYGSLRWGSPAGSNSEGNIWALPGGEMIAMQKVDGNVMWVISNDDKAYQNAFDAFTTLEY